MKQDDEDDAPTYVLEDTNQSMSKEEYEAFVAEKVSTEESKPENQQTAKVETEGESKAKDKITEVGSNTKKRKAAKIISEELDRSKDEPKDAKKLEAKTSKKPKKKIKTVKLTFGDEEES